MTATVRTDTLLSVESVCLTMGGNQILRDVSFRIDDLVRTGTNDITGQVVALLGPSGGGKTCLLRILAGLLQPTSGSVSIGQERRPTHAGLVGMVAQRYPLLDHRTILGNLELAADLRADNVSSKECRERAMELLVEFDLADKARSYPAELSGGQKQRVAIAQQLLCSDHFILFDEPTAGLDPRIKKAVCRTISKVANRDERMVVCIVTHDIPSAVAMADTVLLLGKERDTVGNQIPGARIIDSYDLVAREIMWHEDVTRMPVYRDTVAEIQDRFDTL